VAQILRVLPICQSERHYEDTFLHSLVSYLISMVEDFTHEDFVSVVFDNFFKVRTFLEPEIAIIQIVRLHFS